MVVVFDVVWTVVSTNESVGLTMICMFSCCSCLFPLKRKSEEPTNLEFLEDADILEVDMNQVET